PPPAAGCNPRARRPRGEGGGALRLGSRPSAGGLAGLGAPGDALGVDPPQQPPRRLGSNAGPAGRDVEADLLARDSGACRSKERSRAGSRAFVVDGEAQPDLRPPWIQAFLDAVPTIDERHGANRTLRPVAKVEHRTTLGKSELGDVLREMLLIRRFEEKVEERFRAGELPGFLHVAIGQEACAVGVCRALEDGDVIAS